MLRIQIRGTEYTAWVNARQIASGWTWGWLLERCLISGFKFYKGAIMEYASAYYVSQPNVEIYVFVDEEPSGLPDGAAEIAKSTDIEEFLSMIEPYFIIAKGT